MERQAHWDDVYGKKQDREVSWFEPRPDASLELIEAAAVPSEASIIDIGGGTSRLIDHLLDAGFTDLSLLDVSENALERVRTRLSARAARVRFIRADIAEWQPDATFELWHDRAALHFLTTPNERQAYARTLKLALRLGGHAIFGSFALTGPERCSGLPVQRYDSVAMQELLGPGFRLEDSFTRDHMTPARVLQRFQFA